MIYRDIDNIVGDKGKVKGRKGEIEREGVTGRQTGR